MPQRRQAQRRTAKPTVLFVCHNHPAIRPGGAEAYALELHRHLSENGEFDSVFLAKGGPPLSHAGKPHLGTFVSLVGERQDEYFLYTDGYEYDWVFGTLRFKGFYTKHLHAFLDAIRPDVVHFHHTMHIGYDAIRQVRNTLPDAAIVYTLHEFMPICHRQGQMVRTLGEENCLEESPRRCHECFPDISPQTFFLRKRFIQANFALVDLFIAPSEFLLERYVDWGIPRERIVAEEYGRTPPPGEAPDDDRATRDRFGFFGQLTPFKGVDVVLEAVRLLVDDGRPKDPLLRALETAAAPPPTEAPPTRPEVWVHGANLDLQPGQYQNRVKELLEELRECVRFVGRYEHAQMASLMGNVDWVIVPSVWWENSPLVIQEAKHFGRPVICSDIGGMAEKVADGVDGLHFRAGDPASLARTMRYAMDSPGLWSELRRGIAPIYSMEDHVANLGEIYRRLLGTKVPARVG